MVSDHRTASINRSIHVSSSSSPLMLLKEKKDEALDELFFDPFDVRRFKRRRFSADIVSIESSFDFSSLLKLFFPDLLLLLLPCPLLWLLPLLRADLAFPAFPRVRFAIVYKC